MRRIKAVPIHGAFYSAGIWKNDEGVRPKVAILTSDWRKIRRVLMAAEMIRQRGAPGTGWDELRDAIDALNKEPKK